MDTKLLLEHLVYNYSATRKKMDGKSRSRWLGGMEAFLIQLGVLQIGGFPYDYEKKQKRFLFIPYTSKESYEEFILRKSHEAIK